MGLNMMVTKTSRPDTEWKIYEGKAQKRLETVNLHTLTNHGHRYEEQHQI